MLVAVFDFTPHALENVPIGDCMRHGMVSCDHVASLAEVAAIMTAQRVHAVVVTDESGRPSGIISDLDVIAGAASEEDREDLRSDLGPEHLLIARRGSADGRASCRPPHRS